VYAQISWGKKLRIAGEFLRTKLFGRNFSNHWSLVVDGASAAVVPCSQHAP
jgi:hypothetical protein